MNELCSRWNEHELHENHFALDIEHGHRMVEMSEDANYLVYRRGTGANRLRRVASSESSNSDDSLVAGPPMIDFNEPLPNLPENDVDDPHPNPISTGDVGSTRDLDMTLPHASSNTSRENLQSVVSQLGLDIPIQNKNSCHAPQHLHSPQQSTCCRHAAHNISIESLDLDITGAALAGGANYCCGNPGNNKFGRRLLSRRSCSSIH